MLEALIGRTDLIAANSPPDQLAEVLRLAVHDPSSLVRAKVLGAVGRLGASKLAGRLILASLLDEEPGLRRVALGLADDRDGFWAGAEARQRRLWLLVDPDARVRDRALESVERPSSTAIDPALARRLKALSGDPDLKARAEAYLVRQGIDPAKVLADVDVGRPRLPSFATFRDKINPLFSQVGDDGQSCIRCHDHQAVFQVVGGTSPEALLTNYRSALKVLNLGDPEASLLVRKPRAPQGRAASDEAQATGTFPRRWPPLGGGRSPRPPVHPRLDPRGPAGPSFSCTGHARSSRVRDHGRPGIEVRSNRSSQAEGGAASTRSDQPHDCAIRPTSRWGSTPASLRVLSFIGAVALGQPPTVGPDGERDVAELGRRPAQGLVKEDLPGGARDEVVAPDHLGHAHRRVVMNHRQLVGRPNARPGRPRSRHQAAKARRPEGRGPGRPNRPARVGPGIARQMGGRRGPRHLGPGGSNRFRGRWGLRPRGGGPRRPARCLGGCRCRGRPARWLSDGRARPDSDRSRRDWT